MNTCTEEERRELKESVTAAYNNAPKETNQENLQKVQIEREPARNLTDEDVVTVVFGEQSPHQVFLGKNQLHLYPTLIDIALRINPGFLSEEQIHTITKDLLEHESKHLEVAQSIGLEYRTGISFTKTEKGQPTVTPSVSIRGECTISQIKEFLQAPSNRSESDSLPIN